MELSIEAKKCRREYNRMWRVKNREHVNAYLRAWRARNPSRVKEHNRIYWEKKARINAFAGLVGYEKARKVNSINKIRKSVSVEIR